LISFMRRFATSDMSTGKLPKLSFSVQKAMQSGSPHSWVISCKTIRRSPLR